MVGRVAAWGGVQCPIHMSMSMSVSMSMGVGVGVGVGVSMCMGMAWHGMHPHGHACVHIHMHMHTHTHTHTDAHEHAHAHAHGTMHMHMHMHMHIPDMGLDAEWDPADDSGIRWRRPDLQPPPLFSNARHVCTCNESSRHTEEFPHSESTSVSCRVSPTRRHGGPQPGTATSLAIPHAGDY